MAKKEYFNLIRKALPEDVDPEEIRALAPEQLWRKDPYLATLYALSKSQRINWPAYLRSNPDLEKAGVNPLEHFLADGVYEGRKLASWHPLKQPEVEGAPLVSVIISIYNNDSHLAKCLASATRQTLKNIEILAIDDASTDRSSEIIQKFAKDDKRVRHIRLDKNGGIFMSRKKGVNEAKGRYVMFMDGDDFLDPRACEIAFGEISKGYDIVEGGANLILTDANEKDAQAFASAINDAPERIFSQSEIAQAVFFSGGLVWPLWSKIYLREICVAAYNDLEDGYYLAGEDGYALLAISRFARNAKKIHYRWYNYNYGPGISTTTDIGGSYDHCMRHGYAIKAMAAYARKHCIDIKADAMLDRHCKRAIANWLEGVPESEASRYFGMVIDQFGLQRAPISLATHFQGKIASFAPKLAPRIWELTIHGRPVKKIGVFYPDGARSLPGYYLPMLVNFLKKRGMEVTLFIEGDPGCLPPDFPKAKTIYLERGGDPENLRARFSTLCGTLSANRLDLALYIDSRFPGLFSDMVALAESGAPTIVICMDSFCDPFIYTDSEYRHHDQEGAYQCAKAVACLTRPTALYLGQMGARARYCGFPVQQAEEAPSKTDKSYDIAFFADPDDPNSQLAKALMIVREIARKMPSISMIVIGDFANAADRDKFYETAKAWGINENIHLSGKTSIGSQLLKSARILLSTSYIDSFGFAIAEAQAAGMPCVAYDLPLEIFDDNESIIRVPQGDITKSAEGILALCQDDRELRRLSRIARQKAGRFAPDIYFCKLGELIDAVGEPGQAEAWSRADFEKVILYSAWYSERERPVESI